MYETNRNNQTTGAASAKGHFAAGTRPWCSPNRSAGWGNRRCCNPMEKSIRNPWREGFSGSQSAGKKTSTLREKNPAIRKAALERGPQKRLLHRAMDTETCGRDNLQAFWRSLRTVQHLACVETNGLELPKARTQSPRTRRAGRSHLAKDRLAPYKKKPKEAAKPLFCWMKAALCFSQLFDELGLREDKLPSITVGTAETDSRPSPRSLFRPNANAWDCILPCMIATLSPMILRHLWQSCSRIFHEGLSWLWIAGWFIAAAPKGCRDDSAVALMWNGCRLTHRILILWSRCGIAPSIRIWLTLFQRMFSIWGEPSASRFVGKAADKICCVRFSIMQN